MKISTMLVASALALAVAAPAATVPAPASIPSDPAPKGFKVLSGTLNAVVDGKTVTYKAGDAVPQQAVVTADSDAKLDGGNGTTIALSKGTSFEAALTSNGLLDIKSAGGGPVTVTGGGKTAVIPVGGEVDLSPTTIQVVKGEIQYTYADGKTYTYKEGQGGYTGPGGNWGLAGATTILTPPASPSQEKVVVPVSPSAP